MKYYPPVNSTNPDASYIDGTRSNRGSIVPAKAIEDPQREIVNVITSAGHTPSEQYRNQLTKAIKSLSIEYDPSINYNYPVLVVGSNGILYLWNKRNGPLSTVVDPVRDLSQEYWVPMYEASNGLVGIQSSLMSIRTELARIADAVDAWYYQDGVEHPERSVLCYDRVWRDYEDIAFPLEDDSTGENALPGQGIQYELPVATSNTLGGVYVDSTLSKISTNPVENRAVKIALDSLHSGILNIFGGDGDSAGAVESAKDQDIDSIFSSEELVESDPFSQNVFMQKLLQIEEGAATNADIDFLFSLGLSEESDEFDPNNYLARIQALEHDDVLSSPAGTRDANILANTDFTIPQYRIGTDSPSVYLDGILCLKDESYIEVGTEDSDSTTIQFLQTIPTTMDIFVRVN